MRPRLRLDHLQVRFVILFPPKSAAHQPFVAFSMAGALNKLPVAASGIIFFGDPATLSSVTAIGVGFVAGIVYALAKNNQNKEKRAREAYEQLPLTKTDLANK